jgi:stage V sporulation protein B
VSAAPKVPDAEADARPRPAAGDETTRAAGRGGLAIAAAKVSFILFGFAQQVVLPRPRFLGVAGYGQFSLVLGIVSIVNNVMIATSIQGVSHAVSSAPEGRGEQAFRRTLGVHLVLAVILAAGFAALAGVVADLEKAPSIAVPLRLGAAIVLLYGIYGPLVGSLNGRRRFGTQAALDTGYGAMRMAAIVLGALLFQRAGGSGVLGAVAGFVAAALVIVPVALSRTGIGRAGEGKAEPTTEAYLAFLVPLAVSQAFLNLLMQTDSLLLRSFTGAAASSETAADALQGVYRGAQLFSFLPYQLLMSITFILFPMLARAQAEGDRAAVKRYTVTGVRLALVLTVLMTGTVAATAPHLLRVVFPVEIWSAGGDVLRVLSLGMGSFSVLGILCAALTGLGHARRSAGLTLVAVALVAAGSVVLVPRAPFGPGMLVSSAIAASIGLTTAAVIGGFMLHRVAGGSARPLTLARCLAALAITVTLGSRIPWLGVAGTVVEAAAAFAIGLVVLIVLGEVGREDLERVLAVAGRRK